MKNKSWHPCNSGGNSFALMVGLLIGPNGTPGLGYFCAVSVSPALAGAHLKFNKESAKPASPTP